MPVENRRYERIEIELPCRIYIPEGGKRQGLKFEAFCRSTNLGLGGIFLESTFLLKTGLELWVELHLPDEALPVRGRIAHTTRLDDDVYPTGFGIEFLDVGSEARETLLRYFTPQRYRDFYEAMTGEFPHLAKTFALPDASLLLNLWEEWKVKQEGGPPATASGAPKPSPKKGRGRRR